MALKIKVTRKGIPLTQVIKNFRTKVELTKTEVKALGLQTRDHMRGVIKQNSQKSQGKLAAAIDIEYFATGWGVGNIADMDSQVEYWKNVNYGHAAYVIEAKPAKPSDLYSFHEKRYIDCLKEANHGISKEEWLRYGLGTTECPVYEGVYDYHLLAVGATLLGMQRRLIRTNREV